jgi:hypothetical protein
MESRLGSHSRISSLLASKWLPRISVSAFLALTVYFGYPYFGYRTLFRQTTSALKLSIISQGYLLTRNLVYASALGLGLLLMFLLFWKAGNNRATRGIVAVQFAWLGFVLEASAGLNLQWIPYNVWILHDAALIILLGTAGIFLAASLLFLTNYKWTRIPTYLACWFAFLFNLTVLLVMLRFFAAFTGPFPTLGAVMTINSGIAVIYLYRNSLHIQRFRWRFPLKLLGVVLLAVLAVDTFAFIQPYNYTAAIGSPTSSMYVGIAFGGDTVAQAKLLIDKVKNCTNLFVVDSWPLSQNQTALNEVCDYAVHSGLYIIVYFAWFNQYWQASWLDSAKQRWGDKFLGIYLYDEPGGIQLDDPQGKYGNITNVPTTYAAATKRYIQSYITGDRGRSDMQMLKMRNIKAFTSDYALYWFDFEAGYDCVFAQFTWNYSRQLNIALARGAATVQNKDWGAIITWSYNSPPYIESGQDLYNDMTLAYNNGAKYILIFDYPYSSNSTYGILQQEHFQAIQSFWNYKSQNPQPDSSPAGRIAYVLPSDFAYGFRGPNDTVWGVWPADAASYQISVGVYNALQQYGPKLDLVYDGSLAAKEGTLYSKLLFSNETAES